MFIMYHEYLILSTLIYDFMKLFSKIAYHSTSQDNLTKFSKTTGKNKAYSGEGAMVHGWGLYLQADKELNIERYKSMYPSIDITLVIGDTKFYGHRLNTFTSYGKFEVQHFNWFNEKSKWLNESKDTIETELMTMLVNVSSEYLDTYFNNLWNDLMTDEEWKREPKYDKIVDKTNHQMALLKEWESVGFHTENDKKSLGVQYEVEIPDDMNLIDESNTLDPYFFAPDEINDAYQELINEAYPDKRTGAYKSFMNTLKTGNMNFNVFVTYMNIYHPDGMKGVTECMIKHGIDGLKYNGGVDGECYVIYNCSKLKIINKE